MKEESYVCDVCRKRKGDGNKWLMYDVTSKDAFVVYAWETAGEGDIRTGHLCSEACAVNKMVEIVRGSAVQGREG